MSKIGSDAVGKAHRHRYRKVRKLKRIIPKLSKKTKVRLEGLQELGEVAATQNPLVSTVFAVKDTSEAVYKITKGKQPKFNLRMM